MFIVGLCLQQLCLNATDRVTKLMNIKLRTKQCFLLIIILKFMSNHMDVLLHRSQV